MFKVPDWEDTPKNNISFTNEPPPKKIKQKSKKTKSPELSKQVVLDKPMFKVKAKANSKLKLMHVGQKTITNKNLRKFKPSNTQSQQKFNLKNEEKNSNDLERNRKDSDYGIMFKNYNSDKLDEMILDVKKQRLDSYKNDDNEEILFNEGPKKVIEIKKIKTTSIKTTRNITDNNSTKSTAKPKQELSSPVEDDEKQKICKDNKIKSNKNDDNEEILFNEGPKKVIEIKKIKTTSIKTTKNITDNNSIKSTAKLKQELSSPVKDDEKQKICKDNKIKSSKNDDYEEILFNEGPKKVIEIKKIKTTSIKSTKNITDNNSTKSTAKPKQELSSPVEDNEKQKICKDNKIKSSYSIELENGITNKQIRKTDDKRDRKNLRKKQLLKSILQKTHDSTRNHIKVSGNKLRERMLDRLKAAKFRYLNEKLYTSSGSDAQQLFQADPSAFQTYHEGYQQQVSKWPIKPLDVIVKRINKMPKTYVIADMGCGQAELAKRVAQSVRSFDLVAAAPGVEACDMARTPLLSASVDVAVYCLALMGTELTRYLIEANRVLKLGGHLLIAEVESRFDNIDTFTSDVQRLGFSLKKLDDTQQVFFFLEFTKVRDPPAKKGKLPTLTLKPCIYKKR